MQEQLLLKLINDNKSLSEISRIINKPISTTKYWLHKYNLKPTNKQKTSILWKLSKDELQAIINNSNSFKAAYNYLYPGLSMSCGAYTRFKRRLIELNIDVNQLIKNRKCTPPKRSKQPLIEIMVENSTYSRHWLKLRLIEEQLIENKCAICGLLPSWHNKPLSLRLDHKNGIHNDNRLENLRLLCPNCDSQTPTYAKKLSLR